MGYTVYEDEVYAIFLQNLLKIKMYQVYLCSPLSNIQ